MQHSETTEPDASYAQMSCTLDALQSFDVHIVAIYPCSDPGYDGILKAYEDHSLPNIRLFKNLDSQTFWGLMAIADALVVIVRAG